VYFRGYLLNRLLILIIAILIPVYFYTLIYFSGIRVVPLTTIENIVINNLFNFVIIPLTLASPWLILIYVFRNRLANTLTFWADKNSAVPLRYLIFYGINAAIMSMYFIFPIISPALSIFTAIVLAWHIISSRDSLWLRGRGVLIAVSTVVFIIVLAIPVLVAVLFYPAYIQLSEWLFVNWQSLSPILYSFSIWVVNAITIGTAIWVFYYMLRGRNMKDVFLDIPMSVRILELVLFSIFAYLWIPQLGNMAYIIDYINWVSLGLLGILILLKLKLGIAGNNMTLVGIIVAGGFIVVDLLYKFSILMLTLTFALTTFIFIVSFIYAFAKSSDELEI